MPLPSLPSLPDECSSDILSFLDNESLYKCLFVNRYYCKLSIPIIWRDPFTTSNSNRFLLINTLLSCLNEDEISSLIPCAINSINFNNQPLFEYGRFIRKIGHGYCIGHIIEWLDSLNERILSGKQDCRVQKLTDAIYHMIMRKGSNLQEFDIYLDSYRYIDLPKFSTFTIYKPGITNLSSLSIHDYFSNDVDYQNAIEFLSMVSEFCNCIINCEVWIDSFTSIFIKQILDIAKLQPLKRILLSGDDILNIKKILYTLKEFRTETLKELSFLDIDFQKVDLSFITKLKFLERLEFENCNEFTFKEKLHLKELKLCYGNYYDINSNKDVLELHAVSTINLFCSEILHKLTLNIVTPETIKAVKENCPNISFLCIEFSSDKSFNSTIPLICKLLSLKTLNIKYDDMIMTEVGENLLIRLLCNHLISVEGLFLEFCISLQNFEYFTNNCKVKLKRLNILVENIMFIPLRKNYLVHVNDFQKAHNSLRIFGIKCGYKSNWTNEEMEIVNLLKNQGIDIVSSYELMPPFLEIGQMNFY